MRAIAFTAAVAAFAALPFGVAFKSASSQSSAPAATDECGENMRCVTIAWTLQSHEPDLQPLTQTLPDKRR